MDKKVIYNLKDTAIYLAECADIILRGSLDQPNDEIDIAPIFVSMLFQSLEFSLKYFGIESDLITEREFGDKERTKNGHGVKEIAKLINTKLLLQGNSIVTYRLTKDLEKTDDSSCRNVVYKMLFGEKFERTREVYRSINLLYLQLEEGKFVVVVGAKYWVDCIKSVAQHLDVAVALQRKQNSLYQRS